jgi:hypothetical protein
MLEVTPNGTNLDMGEYFFSPAHLFVGAEVTRRPRMKNHWHGLGWTKFQRVINARNSRTRQASGVWPLLHCLEHRVKALGSLRFFGPQTRPQPRDVLG